MVKKSKADKCLAKKENAKKESPLNPFEIRHCKAKHKVLGVKENKVGGVPGVSRSRAIEKRTKTLGVEYKKRLKKNKFIDQRFGAGDENISLEEKMMKRFAMERQKHHSKHSIFNLEEDELTHKGQAIDDMTEFNDVYNSESEGDDEPDRTTDMHFGGFLTKNEEGTSSRHVSSKDIMEEIVAKSKLQKMERQKEKEENTEITEGLDKDWTELHSILAGKIKGISSKPKRDGYDIAVRELAFESKAKPTDRLKTDEELAKDRRERLEKLEEERLERMKKGTETATTTSADALLKRSKVAKSEKVLISYTKEGKMVKNKEFDDALEKIRNENAERREDESSSEEGSDEESDDDANEVSGEDKGSDDAVSDDGNENDNEEVKEVVDNQSESDESENEELTVANMDDVEDNDDQSNEDDDEEVEKIVDDQSESDESENEELSETNMNDVEDNDDQSSNEDDDEVVEKVVDDQSESDESENEELSAANMDELEEEEGNCAFEDILVEDDGEESHTKKISANIQNDIPFVIDAPEHLKDFMALIANRSDDDINAIINRIVASNHPSLKEENVEKTSVFYVILIKYVTARFCEYKLTSSLLDTACRVLFSVTKYVSKTVYSHLFGVVNSLKHLITKNTGKPLSLIISKKYLIYLYLVQRIYPVTDYKHAILSPILISINWALSSSTVRKESDVKVGLFLCSFVLQCTKTSGRYSPEVVYFLTQVMKCIAHGQSAEYVSNFKLKPGSLFDQTEAPSPKKLLINQLHDNDWDNTKTDVWYALLTTIVQCMKNYHDFTAFKAIFQSLFDRFGTICFDGYPSEVEDITMTIIRLYEQYSVKLLPFLRYQNIKPQSIKMYEPKFDEVYVDRKKGVRNETKVLKKKLKSEMKGAIRELRKDNKFISRVKHREQAVKDKTRKRKVNEIMGFLSKEQGEANDLKYRKKRGEA